MIAFLCVVDGLAQYGVFHPAGQKTLTGIENRPLLFGFKNIPFVLGKNDWKIYQITPFILKTSSFCVTLNIRPFVSYLVWHYFACSMLKCCLNTKMSENS